MANAVEKVNTIAIADIEAINTITDANLQALNTLEFTGVVPEAHTLISTHTASSSSSLDITSGINSTYDVYQFVFSNLHAEDDNVDLMWQANAVGESGFNEIVTSTFASASHKEDASATSAPYYETSMDQHNGIAYSRIAISVGNYSDESISGVLTLYAPSSTTHMKHWQSRINLNAHDNYIRDAYVGGYFNITAAIDEVSFKFHSGNIDTGVIKMYGLAK